jgi:hypothetical protein
MRMVRTQSVPSQVFALLPPNSQPASGLRAPLSDRGLPEGAAAADRAPDALKASPKPLLGAGLGAPAGVPPSVSKGVDAAKSRVGPTCVEL